MKSFILAAGLGTRLKPWTDHHPKCLALINDIPVIKFVIDKIMQSGVSDITVNVHHFSEQVIDYLNLNYPEIEISDETEKLLDTGGALLHAREILCRNEEPILVHNADILSNLDIQKFVDCHIRSGADITLMVSDRDSSRKLIFNKEGKLKGWHSLKEDKFRPGNIQLLEGDRELAFNGIYLLNPNVIEFMKNTGWSGKFSIIDFFLSSMDNLKIKCYEPQNLKVLDIGKPDALNQAQDFFK